MMIPTKQPIEVVKAAEPAQNIQKPVAKKSNWLERIRSEQLDREKRTWEEKEDRARKLKEILDSDSEENDEKNFDYNKMEGDKLQHFLSKIENHVRSEQKILDAWVEKDEKSGVVAKGTRKQQK